MLPLWRTPTYGGALGYGYDGRLLKKTSWFGEVTGNVSRDHDTDFRVTSLKVNGDVIAYQYDNDSLVTKAGDLRSRK